MRRGVRVLLGRPVAATGQPRALPSPSPSPPAVEEDMTHSRAIENVMDETAVSSARRNHKAEQARYRAVVAVWNSLPDAGIGPLSYAMFLGFLAEAGRRRDAFALVEEIERRGVLRSLRLHNQVLLFLATLRVPDWAALAGVLRSIDAASQGPNRATYVNTLRACAAWGHVRGVLAVLELMAADGHVPPPLAVAKAVSACPDVPTALGIVARHGGEGDSVEVLTAVLGVCARRADVRSAWRTYRTIVARGLAPTTRTLNSLLHAHRRSGDLDGLLKAYASVRHTPHPDGSGRAFEVAPNDVTYTILLQACRDRLRAERQGEAREAAAASTLGLAEAVYAEATASRGRRGGGNASHLVRAMLEVYVVAGRTEMLQATVREAQRGGVYCGLLLRKILQGEACRDASEMGAEAPL